MRNTDRANVLNSIFITIVASPTLAAAPISVQPAAVSFYTMSMGRFGAIVAAVLGLIGVTIGWLALSRPTGRFGTTSGPHGAIVGLAAGLIGTTLGGLVAATSKGGVGTGHGFGGAIVALVLGLIALVVGGLALARYRHNS
jgi:hypothetical protein